MKKALLLTLFLLLNGCSYESFLALGEVDKVEVVKQNASVSHYRAYFTRTQLKPIKNRQKYLYFYSKKDKDLAILLYKNHTYTLYSLYHPKRSALHFQANKHTRYTHIKKALRKHGYLPSAPHSVGATSKVALRRYKGIKTLLVEVKDYSHLLEKYKKAIQNYDASSILKTKTVLPAVLIADYFAAFQKKASKEEQKEQLKIIADKLHLPDLNTPNTEASNHQVIEEELQVQEALAKEVPEEIQPTVPFDYYAQEASYHELDTYLNTPSTKNSLTFNQYTTLTQRHAKLKEEKLLQDGSLEALISAYKTNKNPKYKQRILELMKEVQK